MFKSGIFQRLRAFPLSLKWMPVETTAIGDCQVRCKCWICAASNPLVSANFAVFGIFDCSIILSNTVGLFSLSFTVSCIHLIKNHQLKCLHVKDFLSNLTRSCDKFRVEFLAEIGCLFCCRLDGDDKTFRSHFLR